MCRDEKRLQAIPTLGGMMRYSSRCRLSAINFRCDLSSPFKRATLLFRVVSISLAVAMVTTTNIITVIRAPPMAAMHQPVHHYAYSVTMLCGEICLESLTPWF
uniref:Uncharacterized protein n=1 Tax=Anopheles culicifacies TaxID=139723 RepID=A0A182MQC2_9DIPT